MSHPTFDVLVEPWIPVVVRDGSSAELGILDCLRQSHQVKEIKDPSPIIEFGLYRLLVAFVLDALILADRRPEDHYDLRDLIDQGSFAEGLFANYVEACGDVFDLFHPEKPFLQTVMEEREGLGALARLFPAMPSGTNVSHWHHQPEADWRVTPAEAARLLTTIAPFMTAGGAGLSPSINGAPAVYVMPVGHSLHQTLVMNIPLRADQEAGSGVVAWRERSTPGRERTEATTVEALTWRPRKIQLLLEAADDADGVSDTMWVRQMRFGKGDSTRFPWVDANLAYRYDDKKVTPVRMRENRALWRDAGPLMLVGDTVVAQTGSKSVVFRRPDSVDQAFEIDIPGLPDRINAYAMRTDMKMKVFEWTKASWLVPSTVGRSARLGALVSQEIDRAEQAANVLRRAIRSLHPAGTLRSTDAFRNTALRNERSYWMALEAEFPSLLQVFADLGVDAVDDPELVIQRTEAWRRSIRDKAMGGFEAAAKDMDTDGDALERVAMARSRLQIGLKGVLT